MHVWSQLAELRSTPPISTFRDSKLITQDLDESDRR